MFSTLTRGLDEGAPLICPFDLDVLLHRIDGEVLDAVVHSCDLQFRAIAAEMPLLLAVVARHVFHVDDLPFLYEGHALLILAYPLSSRRYLVLV